MNKPKNPPASLFKCDDIYEPTTEEIIYDFSDEPTVEIEIPKLIECLVASMDDPIFPMLDGPAEDPFDRGS